MKNIFGFIPFFVLTMGFNISVQAGDSPEYPAENFKPYVLYQDSSVIEQAQSASVKRPEKKEVKIATVKPNSTAWDKPSNSTPAKTSNQVVSSGSDGLPLGAIGVVALLILGVFWISRGEEKPDFIPEPEDAAAGITEEPEFFIQANWDKKKEVWIATIDDVPGPTFEAETTEALIERLNKELPEILEQNGIEYSSPVTFQLQSEVTSVASG